MKTIIYFVFLLINIQSCHSQERKNNLLENRFINKFIDDNYKDKRYMKADTLFVLACGDDYLYKNNIQVDFLNLEDVSIKVKKRGKFFLVTYDDLYLENKKIKTSFLYLIAIKKDDTYNLVAEDNSNANYYLEINKLEVSKEK